MRFSYLLSRSALVALAVLVISLLVARTNLEAADSSTNIASESSFTTGDDILSAIQGELHVNPLGQMSKFAGDDDTMIAVQSRVQVRHGSSTKAKTDTVEDKAENNVEAITWLKDKVEEEKAKDPSYLLEKEKEKEKEVLDDMSHFNAMMTNKAAQRASAIKTDLSVVTGASSASSESRHDYLWSSGVKAALMQQVSKIRSMSWIPMAVVALLLVCTCAGALSLGFASKSRRDDIPDEGALAPQLEQRQGLLSWPPRLGPLPAPGTATGSTPFPTARTSMSGPRTGPNSQPPSQVLVAGPASLPGSQPVISQYPGSQVVMTPAGSKQVLMGSRTELDGGNTFADRATSLSEEAQVPPPLCPTLVMPICGARFGVPMFELAEVNGDGEVTIVGLSGNPLLRGVVRKIGDCRSLEISMPEQNSAPRATITPSMTELAGHGQKGCKALEIRGMRGVFYGTLEMSTSGQGGASPTVHVMRNGKSVLVVDGNADSLKLSIKSPTGLRFASVRCSSEPFGGVDHVEISVEPRVDTVLVLSVVLAVLLLSPYLEPNPE